MSLLSLLHLGDNIVFDAALRLQASPTAAKEEQEKGFLPGVVTGPLANYLFPMKKGSH